MKKNRKRKELLFGELCRRVDALYVIKDDEYFCEELLRLLDWIFGEGGFSVEFGDLLERLRKLKLLEEQKLINILKTMMDEIKVVWEEISPKLLKESVRKYLSSQWSIVYGEVYGEEHDVVSSTIAMFDNEDSYFALDFYKRVVWILEQLSFGSGLCTEIARPFYFKDKKQPRGDLFRLYREYKVAKNNFDELLYHSAWGSYELLRQVRIMLTSNYEEYGDVSFFAKTSSFRDRYSVFIERFLGVVFDYGVLDDYALLDREVKRVEGYWSSDFRIENNKFILSDLGFVEFFPDRGGFDNKKHYGLEILEFVLSGGKDGVWRNDIPKNVEGVVISDVSAQINHINDRFEKALDRGLLKTKVELVSEGPRGEARVFLYVMPIQYYDKSLEK